MNRTVQEWFRDKRFKELSSADKERAIGNYFDRDVATQPGPGGESFDSLPVHQRNQTRENFIRDNLDPNRPAPPSRGVLGDIGASVGRGVLGAGEMVLRGAAGAAELISGEESEIAPKAREIAKDIAGYREDVLPASRQAMSDPTRRAWTGGVESATTSLLAVAPAVAVGAATGGVGGAAAGYIMGAPMFGLAQYDQSLEDFTKKGVPRDEAQYAALMMGASETGFELFTDALEVATVGIGGLVTRPLKAAAKDGAKRVIASTWKEAAKRGAAVAGTETAGELANVGTQAEIERGVGAGQERFWQAMGDQFGQIGVASLIFGAIGGGLHKARTGHVKGLIEDGKADPEERLGAVQEVYKELARTDKGLAERWRAGAAMAVLQGRAIREEVEEEVGPPSLEATAGQPASAEKATARQEGEEAPAQQEVAAGPVGAAGEGTTEVGKRKPVSKRTKTAMEILTGRPPAVVRQAQEVEEAAAEPEVPVESVSDTGRPRFEDEALPPGREAPMRRPTAMVAPVSEITTSLEAPGSTIADERIPEAAPLPEVGEVEAPRGEVEKKQPWQMTRDEFTSPIKQDSFGGSVKAAESLHYKYVKKAVSEGNPVPAEVLRDYPDLIERPAPAPSAAEAPKAKQPWQMTRDEFWASGAAGIKSRREANYQHRSMVRTAIEGGADVPGVVLAEYPEFAAKAPSAGGAVAPAEAISEPTSPKAAPAATLGIKTSPVAGVESAVARTIAIDRIRYDLFRSVEKGNDQSAVVITDLESGRVVGVTRYDNFESAQKRYLKDTDYARKAAEAPRDAPAEAISEPTSPEAVKEEIAAGKPLPQEKPRTDAAATLTGRPAVKKVAEASAEDILGEIDRQVAARMDPQARVDKSAEKIKEGMARIAELARQANAVFDENGEVGPGEFDEGRWNKLKPIFGAMWQEAKAINMEVKEFVSAVLDQLGVQAAGYFKRWVKEEFAAGKPLPQEKPKTDAAATLTGRPSKEAPEDVRLKSEYEAVGQPKETGGTVESEQAFLRDVRKFGEAIRQKLGYEHHLDRKGKKSSYTINVPPAGGEGTIMLWRPDSQHGVFIQISVKRDPDTGALSVWNGVIPHGDVMWRVTTRKDPYVGLQNHWAKRDITAGELADRIKAEMDRVDRVSPAPKETAEQAKPEDTKAISEPTSPEADVDVGKQLEKLRGDLERKGAGWIQDPDRVFERIDYKIVQSDDRSGYYVVRTQKGQRTEFGWQNKITREKAIDLALVRARDELGVPAPETVTPQRTKPEKPKFNYGDEVQVTAESGLNVGFGGKVVDAFIAEDGIEYINIEGVERALPAKSFEKKVEKPKTDAAATLTGKKKPLENEPKETIIESEAKPVTQEVANEDRDRNAGRGTLEGKPAENVPGPAAEREPGEVPEEPGEPGEPGAVRPPDERTPAPRGVGSGNIPVRLPTDRRRGSGARNYRIPDGDTLEPGGKVAKFNKNVAAIKLLKQLESESRQATPEEQAVLSQFTGWGGLPEAFNKYNYREQTWNERARQLDELLTTEEYESARRTTPNAHYTSPETVDFIYKSLSKLGIKGGKLLEPGMGNGIFMGRVPSKWHAQLTGVELDTITGRIAKQLYPEANIHVKAYEDTPLPDNFFDVAVGNVPFADVRPYDPRYKELHFQLHDYFFAKSLDKVRPGGVVAFITSTGTMDKKDKFFREWMSQRAELIAAFRLPRTAFKGIADTEVTTDILFFKKRPEIKTAQDLKAELDRIAEQDLQKAAYWNDSIPQKVGKATDYEGRIIDQTANVNEYYEAHPENLLGTLRPDKLHPDRAGLEPKAGVPLADDYAAAIERLPKNVVTYDKHKATEAIKPEELTAAPEDIKELTIYHSQSSPGGKVKDKFFQKVNGKAVPLDVPQSQAPRIKSLIALRTMLRRVLNNQIIGNDDALKGDLQDLNKLYDSHVRQHGAIHADAASGRIMAEDPEFPRLLALENWDKKTGRAEKTDVFNRKTIQRYVPITRADSPEQALFASLVDRGQVDMAHIAGLLGVDEATAADQLYGQVFLDPETRRYTPAEEYLAGNVRRKLVAARAALENEQDERSRGMWQANTDALEANQPQDLSATQIDAKLGSPWIAPEYIDEFASELIGAHGTKTYYSPQIATWVIEKEKRFGVRKDLNNVKWGTERVGALDLIDYALNMRQPKVFDKVGDNKVFNHKATMLAEAKLSEIKKEFQKWIWQDDERREALLKHYNENFNSEVLPRFDGSHLPDTFPGMNPDVHLRPWQKDAVWQILHGGNALLDHVVGSGKTYIMITAAMELKRLRMATKPMIVVPKSIIQQFEKAFRTLYPTANILVADVSSENRKETMARISTGNWDAVLVTHPQFERLPMSAPAQEAFMRGQIVELENAIRAAQEESGGKKSGNRIIKEMEKAKLRLEARLKEMLDQPKDQTVNFEELGVDYLFVDEAHRFKNLFFTSKMARVPGVGANKDVNKTMDMLLKTDHVSRVNNGRGVVFATGTPVSNSVSEMFTMMRYLAPNMLRELGIHNFDAWAGTFGNVVTDYEVTPTGAGFRQHSRFSDFTNLWELQTLYRKFTNVYSEDQLRKSDLVKIPQRVGGQIEVEGVEASEFQKQYVQILDERMDAIRSGKVDPREDNALKVTTDGIKAALDMRLVEPEAPDRPDSKLNKCVENVVRVWKETELRRGTQMVFCDFSRPDKNKFNVYDDIKKKLIEAGIPSEEIAFIYDAGNSDERRAELIRKLRDGEVRVMLGSTAVLGEGVNAQNKIVAIHHLDAPWKPAEIEQRNGRAFRQGNENNTVHEFRYVTKGTFDAYRWQILETKAKFIAKIKSERQARKSDGDVGDAVLDAATVKAIASGNPKVLEHVRAKGELTGLEAQFAAWQEQRWKYERSLKPDAATGLPAQLDRAEKALTEYGAAEEMVKRNAFKEDEFKAVVAGKPFTDKKEAEAALFREIEKAEKNQADARGREVANYKGVKFTVHRVEANGMVTVDPGLGLDLIQFRPPMVYKDETTGGRAYLHALTTFVEGTIPQRKVQASGRVDDLKREITAARQAVNEPFANQERLEKVRKQVLELEKELAGKQEKEESGDAAAEDTEGQDGPKAVYYVRIENGEYRGVPDAKRVEIVPWAHTFVHKVIGEEKRWQVSEANTGLGVSGEQPTRIQAIETATQRLEDTGEEKLRAIINDAAKVPDALTVGWKKEEGGPPSPEATARQEEVDGGVDLELAKPAAGKIDGQDIPVADVRKVFPGQEVVQTENGIWVKTKGGRILYVHAVDHITADQATVDAYFGKAMPAGEYKAAGAYVRGRGVIRLARPRGTNAWVLRHESVHWMEDAGILRKEDIRALKNKIEQEVKAGRWTPKNPNDIGGKEDRANWIRQELANREKHRGALRRILDTVADLLDTIANLFTVTARGVVREVESGRVYERVDGRVLAAEEVGKGKIAAGTPLPQAAEEYDIVDDLLPEDAAERYKAAGGVQRPRLVDVVREKAKLAAQTFTPGRMFPKMPNKHFGRENVLLREFMEAGDYGRARAIMALKDILDPKNMKAEDYKLFGLKLVLDDMQRDMEPGGVLEAWQDIAATEGEVAFGFKSKAEVDAALARVDAELARRPEVRAAIERRQAAIGELRKKLVDEKMLPEQVLDDDRYFHHQVLEYANAKRGAGVDAGEVRVRKAGWQYARSGSIKDYNTKYLESEFEVLAQGFERLARKEVLDEIGQHANIMGELKAKAKRDNLANFYEAEAARLRTVMPEMTAAILRQPQNDPLLPFRQKIAMGLNRLAKMAEQGTLDPGPYAEVVEQLAGREAAGEVGFDPDGGLFRYLGWLANTGDNPAAASARMVFKAIGDRNKTIQNTLGRRLKTWREIMKEREPRAGSSGWAEWVPKPGSAWYMTNSINDQILAEVLAGNRQLSEGDVKQVLARGADVRWVIPAELAEVMDGADFQGRQKDNVVSGLAENTLNMWKRWILINPMRVVKYNLNNLSGDLDITLAYDPRILRYAGGAMRDLWAYHYDKTMSPERKAEFDTALRHGVIGGITAHDIPDIGKMADFRQLERAMGAKDNVAVDTIGRLWRGSKNFTQWRENVLRLATYRYFRDRVAAGDRVYGASLPSKVDAISNDEVDRKAGLLARELIGDYGGLSKGGRWLRRKLIPFYSWMEINAPRYWRLMRNIAVEGEQPGRRVAMLGAVAGKKATMLGAKAFMLYGAISLWNALMFPDEEEELGEEARRQLHLILGRREDGSIISLRLQGALSDALSWFNLHDFPEDMRELAAGKKTVYQWAKEAGKEPINKMIQGLRPDIKGGGELLYGKTAYPDFMRPRPIRDKGEYVARMLSLEGFYRRAVGRPMKGGDVGGQVWDDIMRTFAYSANPGETAYYGTREMVGKFMEERGVERTFHEPSDRSNALYWYKTAIKYGDAEAAKRYLEEYKKLGGTTKGLKISVDRAHPLAAMPEKYRTKFLNQLSHEDRETVKRAGQWYKQTYKKAEAGKVK